MAVTIHTTPVSHTPSDNPVQWTFSSDQTAQDNFSYIVTVFVNDLEVANEQLFPESGIYSRFDASAYASNNCNIPTIGSALLADANNYCKVRITVTENYGTPPIDQASTAATNIVCWKARMEDNDFIDWIGGDYANYIYGAPGNWLTNYPETMKVAETAEEIRLMLINNETNITAFKVELFDANDNSIVSDTLNFTATSFQLLICNVSPAVIIASALAITAANFAQASYYKVSANALAGMLEIQIDIDREMTYDTYKRLHFLSAWGSIESYSFGLITRQSGNVESYGYRKTFGEWSGSSFTFSKDQGRDIDYAKKVMLKQVCISDWLTQEIQNYFQINLYGSPLVYEEDAVNSLMIRRRVTNKTLQWKIHENDMIFLEQVELDLPTHTSMTI